MANTGDGADRTTRRIRQIARIWGTVIIGITLVIVIAHVVVPDTNATDYPPSENLLPLAMCLSVAGLGVAWRWEGWGGAINVGFFLANLGLYRVLRGKFLPLRAVTIFSLVLIPGMLFLVCWWRTRSSETIDQGAQHGWKANGSDGGNQGLVSLASLVRGLGQWLLLRQNVKRAGWWILATAIGWVIAAGAGVGAITGTALVLLLRYAPRDP